MAMSRKHYAAIAEVVASTPFSDSAVKDRMVEDLIRVFKRDNSNFKPHLFFRACNVKHEDL